MAFSMDSTFVDCTAASVLGCPADSHPASAMPFAQSALPSPLLPPLPPLFPNIAPTPNQPQAAKQLDLPMLQQLQAMAGAKVASLEGEACDANTSRGKRVRLVAWLARWCALERGGGGGDRAAADSFLPSTAAATTQPIPTQPLHLPPYHDPCRAR